MKELVRNSLPQSVVNTIRPIYRAYRRARDRVLREADKLGIVSVDRIYPDSYYKKRQHGPYRSESNHVGEVLLQKYNPESVIDFGCAIGAYLEPFEERGIEIQGVDGSEAAIKYAVVPGENLTKHDLREPYSSAKTYDLAICIEVAEHLPEGSADTLVETLCNASDTIVFTAAPPGQPGEHHINLQPPEYWIEKFETHGKINRPDHREAIQQELDLEHIDWVEENLLVFTAE